MNSAELDYSERLWLAKKISFNCSMPAYTTHPGVFYLSDKHMAEKMTEKGKKILQKLLDKNMNKICVNGKTYEVEGGNINVINNEVYCNGKLVSDLNKVAEKEIKITIEGNLEGDLKTSSGDVKIEGDVKGSVQTQSGDVDVSGAVGGSISTMSGDVECGNVGGGVSTMSGDISKN